MASPKKSHGGKARSREVSRPLGAELLLAEQNERRNLALELHDDLGQRLALLELSVETLEQGNPSPNQWKEQLQAVRRQITSLSQSLRRISYQLHPATLEHLGLAAALESYIWEFSEREGIPVRFQATQMPEKLDPQAALCLYRIVEEGLRDIARHVGAKSPGAKPAEVKLRSTGSTIQLTVKDSGTGFEVHASKIEARTLACGGVFKTKIRHAGGTELLVEIPGV
jgi:two-component system CheB/CheR fusion protein